MFYGTDFHKNTVDNHDFLTVFINIIICNLTLYHGMDIVVVVCKNVFMNKHKMLVLHKQCPVVKSLSLIESLLLYLSL